MYCIILIIINAEVFPTGLLVHLAAAIPNMRYKNIETTTDINTLTHMALPYLCSFGHSLQGDFEVEVRKVPIRKVQKIYKQWSLYHSQRKLRSLGL